MLKNLNDYLDKILKSKKYTNIIIALCIVGIALIFLSGFIGKSNSDKGSPADEISAEQYKQTLEYELKDLISGVSGAGEVKVLVTLATGIEYIYENEESNDSSLSEDYSGSNQTKMQKSDNKNKNIILVEDGSGGKKPLIKTEIQPTVKGVVVICDGGDNEYVVQKITEIVTVALNISEKNVCVSK